MDTLDLFRYSQRRGTGESWGTEWMQQEGDSRKRKIIFTLKRESFLNYKRVILYIKSDCLSAAWVVCCISDLQDVHLQHAFVCVQMHAALCVDEWNSVCLYAEESYHMD